MDPQMLDQRLQDTWTSVRSYFTRRSDGSATEADDPQPALARELFDLWLSNRDEPHLERALLTAFQLWGNTSCADEVNDALRHLDMSAAYWGAAVHALDRTYERAGRDEERLPALHRLEGMLMHPNSVGALSELLAMHYLLIARDPSRASGYFRQVVSLAPKAEAAERARGYLYEIEHLQPGQVSPPIETFTLEGSPWSLADHAGRVVCIEFWSTDCGFCWPEMPFLREARAAFSEEDFALVGISKDQDERRLREVIQQEELNWPHIWEPVRWRGREYEIGPAVKAYNAQGVPRSVVIGRDRRIIALGLRSEVLVDAIRAAVDNPL